MTNEDEAYEIAFKLTQAHSQNEAILDLAENFARARAFQDLIPSVITQLGEGKLLRVTSSAFVKLYEASKNASLLQALRDCKILNLCNGHEKATLFASGAFHLEGELSDYLVIHWKDPDPAKGKIIDAMSQAGRHVSLKTLNAVRMGMKTTLQITPQGYYQDILTKIEVAIKAITHRLANETALESVAGEQKTSLSSPSVRRAANSTRSNAANPLARDELEPLSDLQQSILCQVKGQYQTADQISKALDSPLPTIKENLRKLMKLGVLRNKSGSGYYRPDSMPTMNDN